MDEFLRTWVSVDELRGVDRLAKWKDYFGDDDNWILVDKLLNLPAEWDTERAFGIIDMYDVFLLDPEGTTTIVSNLGFIKVPV